MNAWMTWHSKSRHEQPINLSKMSERTFQPVAECVYFLVL